MSGAQAMVVLIVLIAVVGSIIKSRRHGERRHGQDRVAGDADSLRLRDEVRSLKERIQVLDRVITDTHARTDLDHQIERLRDER